MMWVTEFGLMNPDLSPLILDLKITVPLFLVLLLLLLLLFLLLLLLIIITIIISIVIIIIITIIIFTEYIFRPRNYLKIQMLRIVISLIYSWIYLPRNTKTRYHSKNILLFSKIKYLMVRGSHNILAPVLVAHF